MNASFEFILIGKGIFQNKNKIKNKPQKKQKRKQTVKQNPMPSRTKIEIKKNKCNSDIKTK